MLCILATYCSSNTDKERLWLQSMGMKQKPKMKAERKGKVITIKGVGMTRRMPKGRIIK